MNSSGYSSQRIKQIPYVEERPLIGVIGGTGLCALPGMKVFESQTINTPYGKPSGPISIGELGGGRIAFLPRHGSEHKIPPHKVPYKANLAALKSVGVSHIIATCVVGSLRKEIEPGDLVIPDQFINLTWGRDDTFEIDKSFIHLPMANPYCEHLRSIIANELMGMKIQYRSSGTVVVIQGPRFSTIAESRMFAQWGGDIVNMTQYPECYFAREIGICYGVIASVTDYDVGVPSAISMRTDSMAVVLEIFKKNTTVTTLLLEKLLDRAVDVVRCNCATSRLEEYYRLARNESE